MSTAVANVAPKVEWIPRVCAVSSCSASIVFSFVGMALMAGIHPSKFKFRHQLIFFLIFSDLLKAVMMLAFCVPNLRPEQGDPTWSQSSLNALGWFTALSLEASDLIILCFAIHLFLIIFRPKLPSWLRMKYDPNDKSKEGGLYRVRRWVMIAIFIVAAVISSCGMISGYYSDHYWAFYEPIHPLWVFTWILRYVIVMIIFAIYFGIYIYVFVEYKKMAKEMNVSRNQRENKMFASTFGDSLWYKVGQWALMLVFPDVGISAKLHGHGLDTDEDLKNIERLKNDSYISSSVSMGRPSVSFSMGRPSVSLSTGQPTTSVRASTSRRPSASLTIPPPALISGELNENKASSATRRMNTEITTHRIQELLNEESRLKFEHRRVQILNQMKLVFIYPLSYCCIWTFPVIAQVIHWDKGNTAVPLWARAPAAFMQGFSAVINVCVFLIREKPWRLLEPEDGCEVDQDLTNWRRLLSFLPMFSHYRHIDLEAASGKRETWTSNESSKFENKRYSVEERENTVDAHASDDDDNEEDLLDFLNRGPPEMARVKTTPRKPHTTLPPKKVTVNWNLNIFNDPVSQKMRDAHNTSSDTTMVEPGHDHSTTSAGSAATMVTAASSSSQEFDLMDFLKTAPTRK